MPFLLSMNLMQQRDRALRKLAQIQALIDQGNLSELTYWRLNHICKRIEKLDAMKNEFQQRREREFFWGRIGEIIGFLFMLFIGFPLFLIWVCTTWLWQLPGRLLSGTGPQ